MAECVINPPTRHVQPLRLSLHIDPWCQENASLHCLLKLSVSPPEPAFQPENLKKKDVVEILSHKKAYNACECHTNTTQGSRIKDVRLQQKYLL